MRSYFKYTNGEAFTLDGDDYTGFLHISDGIPYTGKIDSSDMVLLEPKNTFMANFYLSQGNFNTTYKNVEPIVPFFSNKNDLMNLQGTLTMLRHLNNNNLICFKNLVVGHPTIYQVEKNNNFYYALSSSTQKELIGYRFIQNTIKFVSSSAIFEPVDGNDNWRFLDFITTGSFTVGKDDNFIYFCSRGDNTLHALQGNFKDPSPIEYLGNQQFFIPNNPDNLPDNIYNIYHDEDANQLFIVFNDSISVYNTTYFKDCQDLDSLLLVDIIPLGQSSTFIPSLVWGTTETAYGLTNVTWSQGDELANPNNPQYAKLGNNLRTTYNDGILSCYNKYSNDLALTLNLQSFNISALYSIDIRNTDDNMILLYRHIDNVIKLLYIDPDLLTFEDHFIYSLKDADKYSIRFSGIDSDMFYVSSQSEYQTRFLSAPEWPCGRLESGELYYPLNYTWGQAFFKWGLFNIPWAGVLSESNFYNNLTNAEIIKNNRMYMLVHNIGRIYALNQPPPDRFLNTIPLNTATRYSELACSETSLGLYFNASLQFIIRDVLILFSQTFGSFDIRERSVFVQKLQDLNTITNDYYLNGNETFNVLSIQRILVLINDLQTALLSKSLEN